MRLTFRPAVRPAARPAHPASPQQSEDGSALAMVLAIFAITILLASVAVSASVSGLTFTNQTRAGVQSQAAADAGIAYTIKMMTATPCSDSGFYSQGSPRGDGSNGLNFSVQVSARPTQSDPWVVGCPQNRSQNPDAFVRLVSTGTPEFNGVPSDLGDSRRVEAVYSWTPGYFQTNIVPSGPTIYSWQGGSFGQSSIVFDSAPATNNTVVDVKNGSASCGESSQIHANVVVAQGAWSSGGSCILWGSVWANGPLTTAQSAIIKGSVWGTSLNMSFSSGINGDGWIGGNTTMIKGTTLDGHLTTGSMTPGGGVPGSTTVDPSINGSSPRLPPGTKAAPDWINFKFNPTDWPTFVYTKLAGTCSPGLMNGATATMAATSPGSSQILDLRECTGNTAWSGDMLVADDILILAAPQFTLAGGGPMRSENGPHKVWIVQEDLTEEAPSEKDSALRSPTCVAPGAMTFAESYVVTAQMSVMAYTPCTLTLGNSAVFRGQFYAGAVIVGGSASLTYAPGGLPGVDLSAGHHSPQGGADGTGFFASKYGDRVSIRDLDKTN